jgi:hypothetical protein
LFNNKRTMRALAWLQITLSIFLAVTIIWVYVEYRRPLSQLLDSGTAVIVSTAEVISQTAESVQKNEIILDDTLKLLISSRTLIEEIRTSTQNQKSYASKYADGVRGASNLLIAAGNSVSTIGDSLMLSFPTRFEMDGIRPIVIMTKPFEKHGKSMKSTALELKAMGESGMAISTSLTKDAENVGAAIIESSNHAINLFDTIKITLGQLKGHDLPKAVSELRLASDELRRVSSQIQIYKNIGVVLLAAGLLFAAWCFLNSISLLYMHSSHENNRDAK